MDRRTLLAHVDAGHVWRLLGGQSSADVGDQTFDVTDPMAGLERDGLATLGPSAAGGRCWGLTDAGDTELARLNAGGGEQTATDEGGDAGVRYLRDRHGFVTVETAEGDPLGPMLRLVHLQAVRASEAHDQARRWDGTIGELLGVIRETRDLLDQRRAA